MFRDGFLRVKFLSLLIEELIRINKEYQTNDPYPPLCNLEVREERLVFYEISEGPLRKEITSEIRNAKAQYFKETLAEVKVCSGLGLGLGKRGRFLTNSNPLEDIFKLPCGDSRLLFNTFPKVEMLCSVRMLESIQAVFG